MISGRVPGAHSTIVVVDRAGGAEPREIQPVSKGEANRTAIRFESVNSFLIAFQIGMFLTGSNNEGRKRRSDSIIHECCFSIVHGGDRSG